MQIVVVAARESEKRKDTPQVADLMLRARALEDVLLPELDENLSAVAGALEELEREEAVRARRLGT